MSAAPLLRRCSSRMGSCRPMRRCRVSGLVVRGALQVRNSLVEHQSFCEVPGLLGLVTGTTYVKHRKNTCSRLLLVLLSGAEAGDASRGACPAEGNLPHHVPGPAYSRAGYVNVTPSILDKSKQHERTGSRAQRAAMRLGGNERFRKLLCEARMDQQNGRLYRQVQRCPSWQKIHETGRSAATSVCSFHRLTYSRAAQIARYQAVLIVATLGCCADMHSI